ncbi:MAG: 3'-5' exonuclease [Bacteroidota bacterium]
MPPTHSPATLENLLFLDIETVSCVASYQELSEPLKRFWDKKAATLGATEPQQVSKLFFERAAIYAEFGKIITIGLGYITFSSDQEPRLRVKCLSNHDEKALLHDFCEMLSTKFQQDALCLCAHNGKEFDFPYLCRRMLVQGIPLPQVLDTTGKKPWEVKHLDTMEMWKFGDRKNFSSLDLLATLFGIPSSKGEMDGSQVNHCYYIDEDLNKIAAYCMQDIVTTVQVFRKLSSQAYIQPAHITFI